MLSIICDFLSSSWVVGGLLSSILVLLLTYDYYRRLGLPPGPYGLPFLGCIFSMNTHDITKLSEQCNELCQKYETDVICLTCPGPPMIVLNTFDLVKECFQKRSDLTDREETNLYRVLEEEYVGIIGSSGERWKELRRFSISMLRDFGMGRVGAEERIEIESRVLCDLIKKRRGKTIDPIDFVIVSVANVICGMVFGQRFDHDDEKFLSALTGMKDLLGNVTNIAVYMGLQYKFLQKTVLRNHYRKCQNDFGKFTSFIRDQIAEHKRVYSGEVTDYIHGYLKEMEEGREFFTEKMLESVIIDFFVAGSETTTTTLRWALLAMAAHPEIQNDVYRELRDVIGDKTVSMSDKKNTPYTEAVIHEIQRQFTIAPIGVTHSNLSESVKLNNFTIPPKSMVFANLNQINHDPNFWKNPNEFDPENFFENGKVVHTERLVPFGIGRRSCAGEALARMELYVFFTSLIKEFEVKLETDDTVADLEGIADAVYHPKHHLLRMIARK